MTILIDEIPCSCILIQLPPNIKPLITFFVKKSKGSCSCVLKQFNTLYLHVGVVTKVRFHAHEVVGNILHYFDII